jgi:DTW domain-containing protein
MFAPRVAIRTSLLLVVHVQDLGRQSNTSRLLTLAIRDTKIIGHGDRAVPTDPASHVLTGITPIVLFPGHGARPLTPDFAASLPSPVVLVVPDGNWRQASKMVKRLPFLAESTKVSLPIRDYAGPELRRNKPGGRMSTYEAVARALGILEGEEVVAPLLDFYRRSVDRMLLVRGKLRLGEVYGGIDDLSRGESAE